MFKNSISKYPEGQWVRINVILNIMSGTADKNNISNEIPPKFLNFCLLSYYTSFTNYSYLQIKNKEG